MTTVRRASIRSSSWYIKFPGAAYAEGPIRFKDLVGVQWVRAYIKTRDKLDALPRGFEAWATN